MTTDEDLRELARQMRDGRSPHAGFKSAPSTGKARLTNPWYEPTLMVEVLNVLYQAVNQRLKARRLNGDVDVGFFRDELGVFYLNAYQSGTRNKAGVTVHGRLTVGAIRASGERLADKLGDKWVTPDRSKGKWV